MAGRNWCRLTGHRMPQSTTQKSWPVTCCRTGILWATRELLTSFCWTTTAHPTEHDWLCSDWFQPRRQVCCVRGWLVSSQGCGIHDSINVNRMPPWSTKATDFKSIEGLKSSEAPIEMEYYSHRHKWRHHSLPAGGVASHGQVLPLAMSALCEAWARAVSVCGTWDKHPPWVKWICLIVITWNFPLLMCDVSTPVDTITVLCSTEFSWS